MSKVPAEDMEILLRYAREKGRPSFCEVILSRFLGRIFREATSLDDVDKIYSEMRRAKKERQETIRVVGS